MKVAVFVFLISTQKQAVYAMLSTLNLFLLPFVLILACVIVVFKRGSKWKRAAAYALIAFGIFILFGGYSILQSRSSTAGIGFLFLPIVSLLPGAIGFALGKFHTDYRLKKQNGIPVVLQKVVMIVLSVLIIVPFAWQANQLEETITKNNASDKENTRQREAIKSYTQSLKQLLSENPGREAQILEDKASQSDDRTKLIPIAQNKYASPVLLNKLSQSEDYGVVLSVVRNRNTEPETLEWIYNNHSYPAYFYNGLAANPITPLYIVREIYNMRQQNTGIVLSLARNPSLPDEILVQLINEPNKHLLRRLLDRTHIRCAHLDLIWESINKIKDSDISRVVKKLENKRETCIQP